MLLMLLTRTNFLGVSPANWDSIASRSLLSIHTGEILLPHSSELFCRGIWRASFFAACRARANGCQVTDMLDLKACPSRLYEYPLDRE